MTLIIEVPSQIRTHPKCLGIVCSRSVCFTIDVCAIHDIDNQKGKKIFQIIHMDLYLIYEGMATSLAMTQFSLHSQGLNTFNKIDTLPYFLN